jgi:hypothetical protein
LGIGQTWQNPEAYMVYHHFDLLIQKYVKSNASKMVKSLKILDANPDW